MSGETRLWLIRHAPVAAPQGVIHGPDAAANLDNMAAIGALRARLPAAAVAFASPARRTMQTARALGLDPKEEPLFREQNFGAWIGRKHDDLAKELGAAYREFWRDVASKRPPGGESFTEQISRVKAGLAKLPAGDIILVVHSGTVRAALAIALDAIPDHVLRFVIDPLSLTRIDRLEQGWRIGCVNLV